MRRSFDVVDVEVGGEVEVEVAAVAVVLLFIGSVIVLSLLIPRRQFLSVYIIFSPVVAVRCGNTDEDGAVVQLASSRLIVNVKSSPPLVGSGGGVAV